MVSCAVAGHRSTSRYLMNKHRECDVPLAEFVLGSSVSIMITFGVLELCRQVPLLPSTSSHV